MAKTSSGRIFPAGPPGGRPGHLADPQGDDRHHGDGVRHGVRRGDLLLRGRSGASATVRPLRARTRVGALSHGRRAGTSSMSIRASRRRSPQSIREQAEQKGLADKFEEILVPTEEVVEVKRGAKVSSERKFFPGYVLMKMDLTDETWHLVKNTPKVTGFLGGKGRPSPISEAEATRIMHQVQEGIERPKPSITFEVGEQVRVSRRAVHLVQRLRRGSRRGEGAAQGRGVDLRPRDPGRARILAGREGLGRRRGIPRRFAGGIGPRRRPAQAPDRRD